MNYVFSIKKSDIPLFLEHYESVSSENNDPRILMMFKNADTTITIFQTLKVMIQGINAQDEYLMWSDVLGFIPQSLEFQENQSLHPKSIVKSQYYSTSAIGSDEVGTGDFFGPVVVATAFVSKTMIPELEKMKIRDSKQMTDEYMLQIAKRLKDMIPHVVLVTDNVKFNELTQQGFNMNKIKAYLHNHAIKKCIKKIKEPFDYVILDQFCSPTLYFDYLKEVDIYSNITFLERAENEHLSVAVASIIARTTFLEQMELLNKLSGVTLPLGAGPGVDVVAKLVVMKKGKDFLQKIAKINFKNIERILN